MAFSISTTDYLSNLANPLFLHPGENPALVLVTPLLSDNNYQQWQHDMLVALETKNKEKFVLGIVSCPPADDVLHQAWKHCNKMVISWLTRSMTLPIKQYVMWMESAYEIWTDLLQRFSHGDKFRIADLQEALHSCKQGDSTIQQERSDDYVIKFLRGLNDEFSSVRSQIMLMEPMLTLTKTFSLILQQEREFHNSSSQIPQDSMANFNSHDPQYKPYKTDRPGVSSSRGRGRIPKYGGRSKYCDHCKRTNHTSDNCWIKYGLPQGYKPIIKPNFAISNPSANLTDGVSHTSIDSSADKTQIPSTFSQDQYDAILGLLK
ncbi:uncharacterized protein LOC108322618 [Vigna angularis]|uniref:uncharacterized protein LOC108322618 n=1 Tax=Phaseolus angularis TaxID=3914 RepID=UPI00080A469D|nr:uncharacterized protein LOC108322618 [Vigna angularis]